MKLVQEGLRVLYIPERGEGCLNSQLHKIVQIILQIGPYQLPCVAAQLIPDIAHPGVWVSEVVPTEMSQREIITLLL